MNNPPANAPDASDPALEQQRAALFAGLVMQQANMALTFLGREQRPEGDSPGVDLPTASMFIDTLEMLEARTRGNLSSEEAALLKQTLTTLRISFVQASSAPAAKASPHPAAPDSATTTAAAPAASSDAGKAAAAEDTEARKKFVKHY